MFKKDRNFIILYSYLFTIINISLYKKIIKIINSFIFYKVDNNGRKISKISKF